MRVDLSAIRAVVFDLGGVLIDVDRQRCFDHWAALTGHSDSELADRLPADSVYQQFERGEISYEEYASHAAARMNLDLQPNQMKSGWNAILGPPLENAKYAVEVATQQWPTFLLSNTDRVHTEVWRETAADVLAPLRQQFLSCEIGLRKPTERCFQYVVDAIKLPPASILFFDDLAENVAGANSAGLTSIQVNGPTDVLSALSEQ